MEKETASPPAENLSHLAQSEINIKRRNVALGLAVGDSLGATSEFQIPWEVPKLMKEFPNWPEEIVGGGKAHWQPGEPTDDTHMAMGILQAWVQDKGQFKPETVLANFLKWKHTNPKDIGGTTAQSLSITEKQSKWDNTWYLGGEQLYLRNPNNAANGSIMRNGVVGALYYNLPMVDFIDIIVQHGIITHYGSLPVLSCLIHGVFIKKLLTGEMDKKVPPTLRDIKALLNGEWKEWKTTTKNPSCKHWLETIGASTLNDAEYKIVVELTDFENYDPYHQDYRSRSGYAVLSLRLGLWATHWSLQSGSPKKPEWLPDWIFERKGFESLMTVVAIGADADTNGAVAGSLLAAYHGVTDRYLKHLMVRDEITNAFALTF